MTVIVTDQGFSEATPTGEALELASDTKAHEVDFAGQDLIVVDFPSFADGRGFTIARVLRDRGFTGHLRARGHVICEQYAMARRCGFDDVEISDALAARQPEDQWLSRANWTEHSYQQRLRAAR